MNHQNYQNSSAVTKLQQAYWEAKHNLSKSLGNHDDDCLISTNTDLDSRIQLLQVADNSFNSLLGVLLDYKRALYKLMIAEENFGSALVEYGIKDTTQAGKLMTLSGKAISRGSNQRAALKSTIMELYHEVQTFQFKATVDVLQTVSKIEKVRKSYKSGLMWLKNASQNLDPDVNKKMKKFRGVQKHIKNLKGKFDKTKVDSMQKIDLYLFSRCNLFSKTLVPYREVFCKMSKNYDFSVKSVVRNISSCSAFKFETLKQLNQYSALVCMECHLSSQPKGRSNKRNSYPKRELKCVHLQQRTHNKETKLLTSEFSLAKRVQFKDPLESGPSNGTTDTLLINLNDEDKCSTTCWQDTSLKNTNFTPGKYSEDLMSIHLDCNTFGGIIQQVDGSQELEKEFEKCVGFFESVEGGNYLEKGSSELYFWSLMENFVDLKDTCTEESNNLSPVNSNKISKEETASQWEEVLIEFDPYTGNLSKCSKKNTVDEDC